jgi:Cu2+-exporting ATPase
VKDSQEITLIKKNEEANHYLKLSGVHLSLAIIRQFIYPPIAPLYLGVFIYSNFPLYRRAETSLMKYRRIDYYVSNAFTSIIALAFGQYVAMGIGNFFYFLGDKIIVITQRHSQKILTNTLEQLPSMVWCLRDNVEIEISLDNVHINDIIVVTIGEIIPIDGTIINGNAMIDQHALTGEQQPAEKSIGERVLASTLVISGKIWIKTEKTWKETTVFKIDQILNDSSQFKTQIQLQGETWADKIILPFQGMFLLTTAIYGPLVGLVVLSAHFGNRIRILAPLETFTHLKLASQKSILVKDGCALESLMKVDTILFDKTGTLTNKEFKVGKIILCNNYREDELLTYAAAAECKMTHPIAKAILSKAKASKLTLPDIDDSRYQVGYGITVIIENQVIKVGSIRFMKMEGIVPPDKIKKAMAYAHTKGHSLVMVAVNSCLIGAIELQPIVRSEVKQLINNLRRHGIKHIAIVSGDHKHPTKKLAEELGMDNYFYDILPQDKARIVEQLQKEGKSVCFVGDGINDTIAMKKADVSISLTGASSIATDVAEVVLMDGTLHHLIDLFEISKKLESNLRTSFGLTLVPTVINLSGAFFFNLGFTTAIIIKNIVFFVGLGHALLPMIKLEGTKNKGVRLVKKGSGSN